MNSYECLPIASRLAGNTYPGRGIVIGKTGDGTSAVIAYFIMGRSKNSRNRIFTVKNGALFTEPFDASLVEDPSLILYVAVRSCGNRLIVSNGDHTDTICNGLAAGKSFSQSLMSRSFEPDSPNFTPRISGMVTFAKQDFSYEMSILKSADDAGTGCSRFTFSYPALPGVGHFLHTYQHDGAPIPAFVGEPERVEIPNSMDCFTNSLWNALDEANRISLYVRYVRLSDGSITERLLNKNQEANRK